MQRARRRRDAPRVNASTEVRRTRARARADRPTDLGGKEGGGTATATSIVHADADGTTTPVRIRESGEWRIGMGGSECAGFARPFARIECVQSCQCSNRRAGPCGYASHCRIALYRCRYDCVISHLCGVLVLPWRCSPSHCTLIGFTPSFRLNTNDAPRPPCTYAYAFHRINSRVHAAWT